jgi:hypothetical protein
MSFTKSLGISLCGISLIGGCNVSQSRHSTGISDKEAILASNEVAPDKFTTPLPARGRGTVNRIGDNSFRAICSDVKGFGAKQKDETSWCWAACAQMLRRYNGEDVDQEKIVAESKLLPLPPSPNDSGMSVEIWLALNPDMRPEFNRRLAIFLAQTGVRATQLAQSKTKPGDYFKELLNQGLRRTNANAGAKLFSAADTDMLVQEISAGNPVLVGRSDDGSGTGMGHVVLAYGVDYSRLVAEGEVTYPNEGVPNTNRQYKINQIQVIDPFSDQKTGSLTDIEGEELSNGIDFVLSKAEARAKLSAFMKEVFSDG